MPRGGLELALHGHDVCAGLGVPFDPPTDLCERLRAHTQDWPHWSSPGWSPLTMTLVIPGTTCCGRPVDQRTVSSTVSSTVVSEIAMPLKLRNSVRVC